MSVNSKESGIVELMAPAGNFESLMAAISGGADSIYFGIEKLNMRSHSANNFKLEDLKEVVARCREAGVKCYLTLNIVVYDEELEEMRRVVDAAKEAGVDAIIASDMAAILYGTEKKIDIHISTQLNISNLEAIRFYSQFANVMVLARELSLDQIKAIAEGVKREEIRGPSGELVKIELFCHGALCMAISGKCYLSLHEYGKSANRGECYQICRRSYDVIDRETGNTLQVDNRYIMSPKDLSTISFIDKILDAGVSVLKIEGRARAPEYVKRVTEVYRKGVDAVLAGEYSEELVEKLEEELSSVFNRGFWGGYYQGGRLGEWSDIYGNRATHRKEYVAKVTNYFSKLGVAELLVESSQLSVGDSILIIGPTTGVVEQQVEEIRVELESCSTAIKGTSCSTPVAARVRRGDKVYLFKEVEL